MSTTDGPAPEPAAVGYAAPPLPLLEALAAFRDTELANRPPRTRATYTVALERFMAYLHDLSPTPATLTTHDLAPATLRAFYTWQRGLLRQADPASARDEDEERHHRSTLTYVNGIAACLRYLDVNGRLAPGVSYATMRSAARELLRSRGSYPTPQVPLSLARLIGYVELLPLPPVSGHGAVARLTLLRDRAIITTLFATALRRGELCRLNRADVQEGKAAKILITGKGRKVRAVYFNDQAQDAIQAYLAARDDRYAPLFIRHDKARTGRGPGPGGEYYRLGPVSVWAIVKRYAALAGLPAETTTHTLRHLRARALLETGMPLEALQDILGHSSPATTKQIYAPYQDRTLDDLVARYDRPASEIAER